MLTEGHRCHGDRFHINVLCFCDGSAFLWGFVFYIPGALPLNTPRPLRLSNFCQAKVTARPVVCRRLVNTRGAEMKTKL